MQKRREREPASWAVLIVFYLLYFMGVFCALVDEDMRADLLFRLRALF